MSCAGFANYRIDVVKDSGQECAFACKECLPEILVPMLQASRGKAARVSTLATTSDEPCEQKVE